MYNWLPKDERNRLLRKDASDAIAWIRDWYSEVKRTYPNFTDYSEEILC